MNYTVSLLALAFCCNSAAAGPIADRFAADVLGIPWGSSLDSVVGVFPQGDHFYAWPPPGDRVYLIRDDQDFMGVPRDGHTVLYWFDDADRLKSVTVSFPYERKEELIGALISAFGGSERKVISDRSEMVGWRDDNGMWMVLKTTIDPKNGIAWLAISRPEKPPALLVR
jgi:hypothetical protein